MLFNAWWTPQAFNMHEHDNVIPIPVAVHLSMNAVQKSNMDLKFLQEISPIGARDTFTLDFLQEKGIPAFFSGCMTLFMQNPSASLPKSNTIYLCDVFRWFKGMSLESLLPQHIVHDTVRVTHEIHMKTESIKRFLKGYELIEKYSRAKLVITSRIHVALPCVAMDIPVIFVDHPSIFSPIRIAGLTDLFQTVHAREDNSQELIRFFQEYPWDNPRPNPNPEKVQRLKESILERIKGYPEIIDTTLKYGINITR